MALAGADVQFDRRPRVCLDCVGVCACVAGDRMMV